MQQLDKGRSKFHRKSEQFRRSARVIGVLQFDGIVCYNDKQSFEKDFAKHLVDANHPKFVNS
jgi:hypothetical protein